MRIVKAYRIYIIFLLLTFAFTIIVHFNGLYGQDSYEYLRYTYRLVWFVRTGNPPGDFYWPLLYPVVGAVLSIIQKPVFALQLISMLSLVGAAFYLKKIL